MMSDKDKYAKLPYTKLHFCLQEKIVCRKAFEQILDISENYLREVVQMCKDDVITVCRYMQILYIIY